MPIEKRLAELASHAQLVHLRDDLSVEMATLLNQARRHEEAAAILTAGSFSPGKVAKGWR